MHILENASLLCHHVEADFNGFLFICFCCYHSQKMVSNEHYSMWKQTKKNNTAVLHDTVVVIWTPES